MSDSTSVETGGTTSVLDVVSNTACLGRPGLFMCSLESAPMAISYSANAYPLTNHNTLQHVLMYLVWFLEETIIGANNHWSGHLLYVPARSVCW